MMRLTDAKHVLISGSVLFSFLTMNPAHAAGPVTIDDAWVTQHGSVVTGSFQGTQSQPAISVITKKPLTIQKAVLTGPGNLIKLAAGSDVTVLNTTATSTNPNVYGVKKGYFLTASHPANLLVQNCLVTGPSFGVYVQGFNGGAGQTIKILKTIFNNIDSRQSDGKGGYINVNVNANSHAIQLNGVQGVAGIEIAWNQAIVTPFQGTVNDMFNIYSSSGLKSSHLSVHDNFIKGALPAVPGDTSGSKYSGGGIITDGKNTDTAGTATAWVDIYNNQVVMTANYGIATAAGHDNAAYRNRVVSAGKLSSGAIYPTNTAPGVYNWNAQQQASTTFYNNHVHDNYVGLLRRDKTNPLQLVRNDWYLPGQGNNAENNMHFQPVNNASPTLTDESTEYTLWKQKLTLNNVQIGVQ